jgi:hypothetical protein
MVLAEDHPATDQLLLAEDHPASRQLVLEEDHPASIASAQLVAPADTMAAVVNAAEFVNPAQLVNQPATVVTRSQPMMDLTIGQPQLMELSSGQLLAGDPPPRSSSPLGSPTAGLMCSALGDFAAQEDASLFSLPLPLSSDMNS